MRDFLDNILSNAWVVGICGSIISSIIMYLITTGLLHRKEKREHIKQIDSANMDVIRSLRPYVAEKGLPDKEIIDALIISTARGYKLKTEELYSIHIICEELIREVIENVYVSMEKKQCYTKQLEEYLQGLQSDQGSSQLISDTMIEVSNENRYQDRFTTLMGYIAATLTSFITFTTLFFRASTEELESLETIRLIICLFVFIMVSVIGMICFYELFKKQSKKRKQKNENREDRKDE